MRHRLLITILAIVAVGFTTGMLLAASYAPKITVHKEARR